MRSFLTGLLTAALLAVLAVPALAQRPRQPFGMGGRGGMDAAGLVTNKSVQEELKLSDDQVEKIKKANDEVQAKYKDEREKVGRDREKMMELFTKINKDRAEVIGKLIPTVLKPEQTKRLKQIELQQGGLRALTKEDVQKELKLSEKQVGEIKAISEEVAKDTQALFGQMRDAQGNREKMQEIQKKMTSTRKEGMDKASALLNDEQKKAWKEMAGQPFEIKFESRRPNPKSPS